MEAIKKVFRPGQDKDDEVLYQDTSSSKPRQESTAFEGGVPYGTKDSPDLYTLPEPDKKEHGIMRQIFNPDGEKYNEQSYGTTSTTDSRAPGATLHSGEPNEKPKEHGILRQIFNPGGEKYDAQAFHASDDAYAPAVPAKGALGTGSEAQPVHSTEAADDNRGVLRQLVNPGGDRYDEMRYGSTGEIGSGKTPATTQDTSHAGRDTAIAGATGAGIGAAAHETNRQDRGLNSSVGQSSSTTQSTSGTAPLNSSSTTAAPSRSQHIPGSFPQSYTQDPVESSTSQTTSTAPTTASHNQHATEAAIGGAALGAGGAAAYEHNRQSHNDAVNPGSTTATTAQSAYGASDRSTPLSSTIGSSQAAPGTADRSTPLSSTLGASSTSSQNPQSTSSTSTAPHSSTIGLASSTNQPSQSSYGTTQSSYPLSSSTPSQSNPVTSSTYTPQATGAGQSNTTTAPASHREGEAAALGLGAATAGGIAAHEYNRNSSQTASGQTDSGLTHHVHNGVSELAPARSTHHEPSTSRSQEESTTGPVLHPHAPAYTGINNSSDNASTGKIYNTVVGKHSEHEYDDTPHHSSTSGATTTSSGRAPGVANTSSAATTSSGLAPGLANTSGAATTSRGLEHSSTSRTTPSSQTAQPLTSSTGLPSHERSSQYSSGTAPAALAAQEAMRRHQNLQDSQISSAHHQDRDAAVAGGIGAGAYEAGRHGDSTGPASQTIGPHDSNVANVLDPRVRPDPEQQLNSSTATEPHKSSLMNKLDSRVQTDSAKTEEKSHAGRDAALGAGAGTAVGAGAYEANKHHSEHASENAGEPKQGLLSKLGLKHDDKTQSKDSHAGRDTAIAGTAVGAGAYETEKHHHKHATTTDNTSTEPQKQGLMSTLGLKSNDNDNQDKHSHTARDTTAATATGTGAYETEKHHSKHSTSTSKESSSEPKQGLLSKLGLKHDKKEDDTKHDHTGRDAALVGGAGVGAYEAEKHHRHEPSSTSQTTSSTPYTSGAQSIQQTGTGTGSTRGMNDASGVDLWQAEHETPSTAAHTQSSAPYDSTQHSHTGRDAAIVGGTGAALGAGAYEAGKHHEGSSTSGYGNQQTSGQYAGYGDSETTPPHRSNLMNKLDPRVQTDSARTENQRPESHTGRDAALAGTAGAATGAGVYEADKHHTQSGASQTQTTDYASTGPASKTVGPHDSNIANVLDPRVKPQVGSQTQNTEAQQTSGMTGESRTAEHSHTGRDVAAGTAAGAGTGYVAHEAEEHHKHHGPSVREDEHHHNKLHKEPKEKKEGFFHKLMHPGSKKDKSDSESSTTASTERVTGEHQHKDSIDPYTGLPINVEQYGSGAGGTDGSQQISGFNEGAGGRPADYEKIGKQNVPY